MNRCTREKEEALENLKFLEIAATNSENERNATIVKLEAELATARQSSAEMIVSVGVRDEQIQRLEAEKAVAEASNKELVATVQRLEAEKADYTNFMRATEDRLKIITEERDALAQAAIHTAQTETAVVATPA